MLYALPLRVESDFRKPSWRCGRHLPWLQPRCRAEDVRLRILDQFILWWAVVQWLANKTDTRKARLPHVGKCRFPHVWPPDNWWWWLNYFFSQKLAEDQLKIGRRNSLDIGLRHSRRNAFRFLEGVGFQFVSTYLPTKFQACCCRSLRRGPVDTYSFHDHVSTTSQITQSSTNPN